MSHRDKCHDRVVVQSFFNLLQQERMGRKIYKTRDEARKDIFDYVEVFLNMEGKHVRSRMVSSVEFREAENNRLRECLKKTLGYSF